MRVILEILLGLQVAGFSQISPEEILFIPWNVDTLGGVEYTLDPEGRVGPQNFRAENDTIYLLDQHHRIINQYSHNRLAAQFPVASGSQDFIFMSREEYACLANNSIQFYKDKQNTQVIRQKKALPLMNKIQSHDQKIQVINHDGTISTVKQNRLEKSSSRGIPTEQNHYHLQKNSRSRAVVKIYNPDGSLMSEIALDIETGNLGSFELIGVDQRGRLFLDFSLITHEVPLKVQREVWIVSASGAIVGKIQIPTHYYAMMSNDLRVSGEGILYHMLSAEDGLHFLKWDLSGNPLTPFQGVYPLRFQGEIHYNQSVIPDNLEKKSPPLSKPTTTVTRAEALAIGDTYAVHEWNCTAANLTTSAGVIAPDGLQIITPYWIQAGENIRVPYQWGGFSALSQFDDGLTAGKYAGDRYTSKSSGSSYAVGVDCSGFVSRCWKLTSHYSTNMMDDEIAQPYSSWEDLKPGDAIHKPGHVCLAVDNNPNGTILAVEAAGSSTDWRVNYRTYSYSELSNYTPRYYINMTGPSIPIASPVLLLIRNDSLATINWSLSSVDNINGIQIEYSSDGVSWESLLGDSLISPAITEFSQEWTDGPNFIRLKSINNQNGIVESLTSDSYGYYTSPTCVGKVLIVDGFDRGSGSWGMPYHSFAQWMGEDLAALGVSFETVANEAITSGDVALSDYNAVYWILGDESTVDETFSSAEQVLVAAYLKNGGQLFVSGSEIAWDLDSEGNSADKAFFLNYLRADYVKDNSGSHQVIGTEGGIFAGLPFEFDDGSGGIYQEDYPDVINPMLNAITCLQYSTGEAAGIQYAGLFSDGTIPGKLVYFGFPWETLTDDFQKRTILRQISEWFGFTCTGISPENPLVPVKATLSRGYPNPFNSRVNFNLILLQDQAISVRVYDLQGHLVKLIESPTNVANRYQLSWNGRNDHGAIVASGSYFFQVITRDRALTEKILFLK